MAAREKNYNYKLTGSDQSPTLIDSVSDYRKLEGLDSSFTLLLYFCSKRICTETSCKGKCFEVLATNL